MGADDGALSIYQMANLIIQLRPINVLPHFAAYRGEIPLAHSMERKGFAMSTRLMLMLFLMIATTIAGILITAVLSMGMTTGRAILIATAVGFVVSIPVSWLVARAITKVVVRS